MVVQVRKSKKVVTVALVRDAVAALSERNGSNIKSIFNYLVWQRQANSGARKQVILALRKAIESRILAKRGKVFVVPKNRLALTPSRESGNRKARHLRKRTSTLSKQLSLSHRFRDEKNVRQSSKRVQTPTSTVARKSLRSNETELNSKNANVESALKFSTRPRRKCVIIVRYTA